MMSYKTRSLATLAIALQLAQCHGFASSIPTNLQSSSALNASPRRTHTYSGHTSDSATVFSQIDKDGNGKIDAQELRDYLVERGPYTEAVAKSIFERLDANRDGHLVLEELDQGMKDHDLFRATAKKPKSASPDTKFSVKAKSNKKNRNQNRKAQQVQSYREQAQRFFEKIDANRDGYISLAELKEHFLVKRMQVVAQSSGLLTSLKGNRQQQKEGESKGNQFVSWHHSEAAIHKLFQVLDVNDDGRISLQEWREAFVKYPSVRHAFQA